VKLHRFNWRYVDVAFFAMVLDGIYYQVFFFIISFSKLYFVMHF